MYDVDASIKREAVFTTKCMITTIYNSNTLKVNSYSTIIISKMTMLSIPTCTCTLSNLMKAVCS